MENFDKPLTPYQALDLLHSIHNLNTPITEFGLDRSLEEIQGSIDVHNQVVLERVAKICDFTTEKTAIYGEHEDGYLVGIPTTQIQTALNWTPEWLEQHSIADLALQIALAFTADIKNIERQLVKSVLHSEIMISIGMPEPYFCPEPIYPLLNGEDLKIPSKYRPAKGAEKHNHYSSSFSLSKSIVHGLYDNVAEHSSDVDMSLFYSWKQKDVIERLGKIGRPIKLNPVPWMPLDYFWMANITDFEKPVTAKVEPMEMQREDNGGISMLTRWAAFAPVRRHQSAVHFLDTPKYKNPAPFSF